jgi:membrane protease YdiL (CAAX protease family)
VTVVVLLLIWTLVVSSAVLWGRGLLRWRQGEPLLLPESRTSRPPDPLAASLAIGWVVLNFVLRVAGEFAPQAPEAPFRPDEVLFGARWDTVVQALVTLILWQALTRGQRLPSAEFGMHFVRWRRQLAAGVLGFVAAWLPVLLVLWITQPLRTEERLHPLLRLLSEAPSCEAYFWAILAAVLIAPLAEELIFRVILQGSLVAKLQPPTAIGITALIFAGAHGFPDSLALVPLALVLGYLYHQRFSYLAIVTTHALFNGTMLALTALLPDPPL